MSDLGKLIVSVPAVPDGAGQIVEIRDHSLRLVERAAPGSELQLDQGLYVASVVLPSGEEHEQAIDVLSGGLTECSLGPDAIPLTSAGDDVLEADLPRGLVFNAWSERPPSEEQRIEAWYARVLRADGTPVREPLEPRRAESAGDDAGAVADVDYVPGGHGDALLWLQVAVPGQVPFNCALPALPATGMGCRIRVVAARDAIRATAVPVGSALVDSVVAYLVAGYPGHAAQIGTQALSLLEQKQADPIGAALGAYALLRLDELSVVEDWLQNLALRFPQLPDGPVIAAELAARSGDRRREADWLSEAVRRGTPVFSDGLSLVAARLRPHELAASRDPQIDRLLEIAVLADFAQLVTAYPAADLGRPLASQRPVDDFDPAAGWQRFKEG